MSKKEKQNVIQLDSHGDLFGSHKDTIFKHNSKNWNIVELIVKNPLRLEMSQSRHYTEVNLYMSDDIEQLEKLVEWSKCLQKGVKKHIKKLQKVEA